MELMIKDLSLGKREWTTIEMIQKRRGLSVLPCNPRATYSLLKNFNHLFDSSSLPDVIELFDPTFVIT